jgi:ferritin-like metal-binding protein YciE
MPALKTLEDLFVHELKDLYSAEQQLIKALPKMAKAASSEHLRAGFEEHLEQTKVHAERLEKILDDLGQTHRGPKCKAMEGLLEEGKGMIDEEAAPEVKDAGLIACAQRVEHYEMAGYGTACTFAQILGHTDAEKMLHDTLQEERETDEKLSELALSEINVAAQSVDGQE